MRRLLPLVLFALAACSADPVPQALCTPGAQSACACPGGGSGVQLCDVTRVLTACVCNDGGALDVIDVGAATEDRPAVDTGNGLDVVDAGNGLDSAPTDQGTPVDRPDVVDVVDAGGLDAGMTDGGSIDSAADVPADVVTLTDDGIIHPDHTAPRDDAGHLLCGASVDGQSCMTNEDCAMCIPQTDGHPWCCFATDPGFPSLCRFYLSGFTCPPAP